MMRGASERWTKTLSHAHPFHAVADTSRWIFSSWICAVGNFILEWYVHGFSSFKLGYVIYPALLMLLWPAVHPSQPRKVIPMLILTSSMLCYITLDFALSRINGPRGLAPAALITNLDFLADLTAWLLQLIVLVVMTHAFILGLCRCTFARKIEVGVPRRGRVKQGYFKYYKVWIESEVELLTVHVHPIPEDRSVGEAGVFVSHVRDYKMKNDRHATIKARWIASGTGAGDDIGDQGDGHELQFKQYDRELTFQPKRAGTYWISVYGRSDALFQLNVMRGTPLPPANASDQDSTVAVGPQRLAITAGHAGVASPGYPGSGDPASQTVEYPYDVLRQRPLPSDVNPFRIEEHLSDAEFARLFFMTKDNWSELPLWKKIVRKKDLDLYVHPDDVTAPAWKDCSDAILYRNGERTLVQPSGNEDANTAGSGSTRRPAWSPRRWRMRRSKAAAGSAEADAQRSNEDSGDGNGDAAQGQQAATSPRHTTNIFSLNMWRTPTRSADAASNADGASARRDSVSRTYLVANTRPYGSSLKGSSGTMRSKASKVSFAPDRGAFTLPPELVKDHQAALKASARWWSWEELVNRPVAPGLNPNNLPSYLHPGEFRTIFCVSKARFGQLKAADRTYLSKIAGLWVDPMNPMRPSPARYVEPRDYTRLPAEAQVFLQEPLSTAEQAWLAAEKKKADLANQQRKITDEQHNYQAEFDAYDRADHRRTLQRRNQPDNHDDEDDGHSDFGQRLAEYDGTGDMPTTSHAAVDVQVAAIQRSPSIASRRSDDYGATLDQY